MGQAPLLAVGDSVFLTSSQFCHYEDSNLTISGNILYDPSLVFKGQVRCGTVNRDFPDVSDYPYPMEASCDALTTDGSIAFSIKVPAVPNSDSYFSGARCSSFFLRFKPTVADKAVTFDLPFVLDFPTINTTLNSSFATTVVGPDRSVCDNLCGRPLSDVNATYKGFSRSSCSCCGVFDKKGAYVRKSCGGVKNLVLPGSDSVDPVNPVGEPFLGFIRSSSFVNYGDADNITINTNITFAPRTLTKGYSCWVLPDDQADLPYLDGVGCSARSAKDVVEVKGTIKRNPDSGDLPTFSLMIEAPTVSQSRYSAKYFYYNGYNGNRYSSSLSVGPSVRDAQDYCQDPESVDFCGDLDTPLCCWVENKKGRTLVPCYSLK